ncbi:MAG TPA: lipid-binding SYLF domain-containing protein [Caulobacteraceae bacterium]|jgi:lipid-binding SYLF domain-containing protein|nr:lipid-binding SYLF domain-containing protein [Caulobacteraceae bacterium]
MTPAIAALRPTATRRSALAAGVVLALGPAWAWASDSGDLKRDSRAALQQLYAANPKAAELGAKARAVLIFPRVLKAGFMVGGQVGKGVLFKGDHIAGYYRTSAASFGFQAGAQSFGYVLFFMTPDALAYLQRSDGWAIGVGPSVVVIDKGMAKSMDTTTLSQAVYAMIFSQQGLMGGVGLQGSKITKIQPS